MPTAPLPVLRITRKFVPFLGVTGNTEFKNIWVIEERVRLFMFPWPKRWLARSEWDTVDDALLAYGEAFSGG